MTDFFWSVITTDGAGRETVARPMALPTASTQSEGTATELAELMLRREVVQAESSSAAQPIRIEVRIWDRRPATPDQLPFENAVWEQDRGIQDILE
ncbi:hypothetical protein DN069_21600 [Streptacidiphilus pinicola]|uniref:Uncharacterized protein n=1 Tax=Streptacidiphilus pinicola TaxID=2219663 RepID=A0A2X0IGC9_9ACTN|nr:hypothetical protein [Streptacidiphilus pinicola]RAG83587.1 hypothetical protein DN069_21600 [Streptacidiphilus pinicola]